MVLRIKTSGFAIVVASFVASSGHALGNPATWSDVLWTASACIDEFRSRQYGLELRGTTDWFTVQAGGPSPNYGEADISYTHDSVTVQRQPDIGDWRLSYGNTGGSAEERFFCIMIGTGPKEDPSGLGYVQAWVERGQEDGVFDNVNGEVATFTVCNSVGRLAHVELDPDDPNVLFRLQSQIASDPNAILPIPPCAWPTDLGRLNRLPGEPL